MSLLPKLKARVADTPGNIAEMLSKDLARVTLRLLSVPFNRLKGTGVNLLHLAIQV